MRLDNTFSCRFRVRCRCGARSSNQRSCHSNSGRHCGKNSSSHDLSSCEYVKVARRGRWFVESRPIRVQHRLHSGMGLQIRCHSGRSETHRFSPATARSRVPRVPDCKTHILRCTSRGQQSPDLTSARPRILRGRNNGVGCGSRLEHGRSDTAQRVIRICRQHNTQIPQLESLDSYYEGEQSLSRTYPELLRRLDNRARALTGARPSRRCRCGPGTAPPHARRAPTAPT